MREATPVTPVGEKQPQPLSESPEGSFPPTVSRLRFALLERGAGLAVSFLQGCGRRAPRPDRAPGTLRQSRAGGQSREGFWRGRKVSQVLQSQTPPVVWTELHDTLT